MIAKLQSPAKINLMLQIKGRREDGYHLLKSIFLPITLFDEIEIEELKSGPHQIRFFIEGKKKTIKKSTVSKALSEFAKLQTIPPLRLHIHKQIPIGAGLGGGSSNAGVILSYLREKYAPDLPLETLNNAASHIGADVPFFLQAKPALVEGIGERISPLPQSERLSLVVIKPPFSIKTVDAYGWYDAQSPLTPPISDDSSDFGQNLGLSAFLNLLQNDLESTVIKQRPEIEELKKALRTSGALGSLMTGSGSAVFGIFRNMAEALTGLAKLREMIPPTHSFFYVESMI